jgi:hypothetical protein
MNCQDQRAFSISSLSDEDQLKILLHQYQTIVDWYKHHIRLLLEANIFIYAVTGSILSYYVSQKPHDGIMQYSLILPVVMNFSYAILFYYGSTNMGWFSEEIKDISVKLNLKSIPDVMFLSTALRVSSLLFAIIAIGILWLILHV